MEKRRTPLQTHIQTSSWEKKWHPAMSSENVTDICLRNKIKIGSILWGVELHSIQSTESSLMLSLCSTTRLPLFIDLLAILGLCKGFSLFFPYLLPNACHMLQNVFSSTFNIFFLLICPGLTANRVKKKGKLWIFPIMGCDEWQFLTSYLYGFWICRNVT